MSGRYLLDTNAVITLLKGNSELLKLTENAEWLGISVITLIEFLVFPDLSDDDKILFNSFSERIDVIAIDKSNKELIDAIISIRQKYKLKLPDSIIAASALCNNAKLISADKALTAVKEIKTISV
ncbi:MAG: type II toxin-antitoxin system VapC family toxin [Spirochaetes bacterium]|nr:type II toxin-antitoxin system VapC family toxin [Spirochaetota bacterium]